MRRRSRIRVDEDFQMAPMIDMVFLLLVFFMTVSTLAKEARPEIELPVSRTAAVPVEVAPRGILTLRPEGERYQLFWYNTPLEAEDLQRILGKGNAPDQREMLLRGAPGTPWKEWSRILDLLRKSGVETITFATLEA